jgi:hypothetical protein
MRKIGFMLIVCLISGCMTTKFTGHTEADYRGRTIHRVLVVTQDMSDTYGTAVVQKLKENLIEDGIAVFSRQDIFPKIRDEDIASKEKRLEELEIDSILEVRYGDIKSEAVANDRGPSKTSYTNRSSTIPALLTTTIVTTQSIDLSNRNIKFQSILYDLKTGNTIWRGHSTTNSGEAIYTSVKTVVSSFVEEMVRELKRRGHISEC